MHPQVVNENFEGGNKSSNGSNGGGGEDQNKTPPLISTRLNAGSCQITLVSPSQDKGEGGAVLHNVVRAGQLVLHCHQ